MLRDKFPSLYENSGMMLALWEVEKTEIDNLQESLESTINQAFINTTDLEIARWENLFGLPVRPNIPLADRQSTVRAKMRGIGVVNVAQIKRTADAFTNGDVAVTEKPSTYEFEIKFTAVKGVPPNLTDLQNAINQIKPAHLNVTYVYTYFLYDQLKIKYATYDSLKATSKTYDQLLLDS